MLRSLRFFCMRRLTYSAMLAALSALCIPWHPAAAASGADHHYKLIVVEPPGGPNSYVQGPNLQVLNNRGTFAGFANTAAPNPNANCVIPSYFNDCFVEHPVIWHDGFLTDLGVLPGGANGQTAWITANGLVAGWSENGAIDPQTGLPEVVAVLWDKDGKIIDLGTVPGGTESLTTGANSHGQVVGFSNNDIPDASSILGFSTQTRAFLWQKGVLKDLGTLGGPDAVATSVNERGQVAGFSYTDSTVNPTTGMPTMHPFRWQNGKMTDLGTLGGTVAGPFLPFSTGFLNNRGDVVGASNLADDVTVHPFLWSESEGMEDLGTLAGGSGGYANWVNDAREVVGIVGNAGGYLHGFLWRDGGMIDLMTVGSDPQSEAKSINSRGQVVGSSFDLFGNDLHGFLWENGGPIADLNKLILPASDVTVVNAFDINDRGEIAGNGVLSSGAARAVLLIPCDEDHPGVEECDYSPVEAAKE